MERLLAFGRSRLEINLRLADLIRQRAGPGPGSYAAYSFVAMHMRHLMGELEVSPATSPLLVDRAAGAAGGRRSSSSRCGSRGSTSTGSSTAWTDLAHRIIQR